MEFHRERFEFIASKLIKNRHLIAIETIPNAVEARALIKLVKQYENVNAWISFSVRSESECISDGTSIEQLVELVRGVKQIFAIGINCVSPEDVEPILKRLKQANTDKLIVIYPNDGSRFDEKTRSFMPNSMKFDWIDKIVEWKTNYNLSLIGGCCRVGPNEISRIRSLFA